MAEDLDTQEATKQVEYRRAVRGKVIPESDYEGWILREASVIGVRIVHEIRMAALKVTGNG